jgi:hypothetical protein
VYRARPRREGHEGRVQGDLIDAGFEPWPQAHKSDPRENAWHKKLCNAMLTLRQARAQELAYKRKYE